MTSFWKWTRFCILSYDFEMWPVLMKVYARMSHEKNQISHCVTCILHTSVPDSVIAQIAQSLFLAGVCICNCIFYIIYCGCLLDYCFVFCLLFYLALTVNLCCDFFTVDCSCQVLHVSPKHSRTVHYCQRISGDQVSCYCCEWCHRVLGSNTFEEAPELWVYSYNIVKRVLHI